MIMELTQDDNLLIQSYLSIGFLAELKNNKFLKSDCYRELNFGNSYIKETLPKIGIDNQGTLLISLYAMLVVPKQILEHEFPEEFAELNTKVDQLKASSNSSYSKDSIKIDYIRHIRNAVAHARVQFIPNKSVIFTDKNNRGEICIITIPLNKVDLLLTELQKVFMKYIEKLNTKKNT